MMRQEGTNESAWCDANGRSVEAAAVACVESNPWLQELPSATVLSIRDALRRPSLRSRGHVHVVMLNSKLTGGGARSLHQLHATLVDGGVRSTMYSVHSKFATRQMVNGSQEDLEALLERGLGPEDVIVLPEIAQVNDAFVEAAGGRVVRWMLGLPRGFDKLDGRMLQVASTHFIRRQITGCVGPVVTAPLEDAMYDAVPTATERRLVLVDDDTRIDIDDLDARLPEPLRATRFAGLSRNETIAAFQEARLFVDAYLPGRERSNYEAALFGVTPVVDFALHGASQFEFPGVPRYFRGLDDLVTKLAAVAARPPNLEALKNVARSWRDSFDDVALRLVDGRHFQFVTAVADDRQIIWILPLLISILCVAPLADLTVFLPASYLSSNVSERDYWLRARLGPAAFDAIHRWGLDTRLRFEPLMWNSLFDSEGNDLVALVVPPRRDAKPLALHVPPRSLIVAHPPFGLTCHAAELLDSSGPVAKKLSRRLLVSDAARYASFIEEAFERHGPDGVHTANAALARLLDSDPVTSCPQPSSAFLVEADDLRTPPHLPSALRDHPLWQASHPLFLDDVRFSLPPS